MRARLTLRRLVAGAALILAAAVIVVVVLGSSSSPSNATSGSAGTATGAATVRRRDLVQTDTESGTLSYANPQTVYNRLNGTITWLPNVGQVIKPGGTLFRVDGEPVLLMDGITPAYRALSAADTYGQDVLQLNRNLVRLGFNPDGITVNDDWQAATTVGVELLQASLGESETGSLSLGQIVFLPGAQLISTVDGTLGSTGGSGSGGSGGSDPVGADTAVPAPRPEFVSLEKPKDPAPSGTPPSGTPPTGAPPPGTPPPNTGPRRRHRRHRSTTRETLAALTALLKAESAQLKAEAAQLKAERRESANNGSKQGSSKGGTSGSGSGHSRATTAAASGSTGGGSTGGGSTGGGSTGGGSDGGGSAGGSASAQADPADVLDPAGGHGRSGGVVPERGGARRARDRGDAGRQHGERTHHRRQPRRSELEWIGQRLRQRGIGRWWRRRRRRRRRRGSSGSSSTIPVTIALSGHHSGAGFDQAAVSVNFAEQRANNVLSVPVTALLAIAGGNYAVAQAAAPHKLIPVTTGLFAAGYVEISGAGIYPGLQVTDSQG